VTAWKLPLVAALCAYGLVLSAQSGAPGASSFDRKILPVLKNTCLPCHNDGFAAGGLMLEEFEDARSLATRRDVWERILKRVRNNQMPPGRTKPRGIPEFIESLEQALSSN
jgi:hypothetical protein